VGRTAAVIDWFKKVRLQVGLKGLHARNRDPSNPAPARTPLFPSSILNRMRSATRGSLFGMKPLLRQNTSIGDTFTRNWATCQQLANEGTQNDPTRVETPLNWPAESAGNTVNGMPLMRTQNVLWRQVVKVAATNLDMQIRNLQPDNSVQGANGVGQYRPKFGRVYQRHLDQIVQAHERRIPLCSISVLGDPQPSLHPPHRNQTCAEGIGGRGR
jgi:hypothetical protein